ncbi:MAG: hypothetical protein ACKVE3_08410 [Dissulfuribacterales bacterium]
MKKWIISILILLSLINTISATTTIYHKDIFMSCNDGIGDSTAIEHLISEPCKYYSWHISYTFYGADCCFCYDTYPKKSRVEMVKNGTEWLFVDYSPSYGHTKSGSASGSGNGTGAWYFRLGFYHSSSEPYKFCKADGEATLIITTESPNNVSGNTGCVDLTSLYINNNGEWNLCNSTTYDNYSFIIYNNNQYKLVFSDGHKYEFICNGSDVHYDYDICSEGSINLYDNCANLLINPFTVIYNLDDNMNIVYSGHDNPVNISKADVDEDDELCVIWSTWQGTFQKRCFAQFDHPINLFDQSIYWNLGIHVWDENVNRCSNALVIYDQDCVINGYPKRNGFTDEYGTVEFTQCENDNGMLIVDKSGYKSLNVTVTSAFDAQTKNYGVNVYLEPDNSSDETDWSLINESWNDTELEEEPEDMPDGSAFTMLLYFRDPDGRKTNFVYDNTPYVKCFFGIKYPVPVNMKLDFERSSNGLYYSHVCSYPYSIDNDSCGYWEIDNSYFSNPDYIYRAHIYDQTDEYIGRYAYLRVVPVEEPQSYRAYVIFDPDTPVIDYREYIKGKVFANATSGSLPDLSLEIYDEDTCIEYFNYTQSDFDSYGWAYWLLGYNYTLHHNYTLLLKNDAGTIVSSATAYADDVRRNRLTIKVVDPSNNPLDHSYIFLKDYGRIPTNNQCYGTFENLSNQDYYYKAEKGGYRSTGWTLTTLTDEDQIVTYMLIPESLETTVRMTKTDVKNLYYPFMYILLIIMLVGGLIHVFN